MASDAELEAGTMVHGAPFHFLDNSRRRAPVASAPPDIVRKHRAETTTTDDDFYGLEPGLPNTFLVFGNVSEEDQLFINSMFEQMRNLHAENPTPI